MQSAPKKNEPSQEATNNKVGVNAPSSLGIEFVSAQKRPKKYREFSFIVASIFVIFTCIFFLLFSKTLSAFFKMPAFMMQYADYKIWLYLLLLTPLLYWLIARKTSAMQVYNQALRDNEEKLIRLNRLYRMLNEMNHMIHRVHDREELLQKSCKIIEYWGGFSLAWIALKPIHSEAGIPEVIVSSEKENPYLADLFVDHEHNAVEEKSEPALAALRKKFHIVVNNVKTFSKKQFMWQKLAMNHGFQSIAAIPLKITPQVMGVLAVYSQQEKFFNVEEMELLYEAAAIIHAGLSLIEKNKNLFQLANFDVTTNLPNMSLFEERISQAIVCVSQEKRFIGVVVVELLDIPSVAEGHSQIAGDKLFQEVGKHFTQLLSDSDTVARIGYSTIGIMILNIVDAHDVLLVMQKLLKPFLIDLENQYEINVNLGAGVAIFPTDGDSATLLIQHAKEALSELSGEKTQNCAFYSKSISSDIKYSQKIEKQLVGALNRHEFQVYYQPIIDINTNIAIGIEALVRWHNPLLGEVPPLQLIPVAEEKGMMIPLSEWILETACQQMESWKHKASKDNGFLLSVNVSLKQLLEPKFLTHLRLVLDRIHYQSKEFILAIELQESAFISEFDHIKDKIEQLRAMGIQIFIDDFGTGFASLSHLSQLPVDVLKIDPIFTRGLGRDQNAESLIRGILTLAKGLGLKTIAEGVETEKQLRILQQLGCTTVQGYYFSPPMPAKNLESILGKPL